MAPTPVIENIHKKILEAVSKESALDMSAWHKDESLDGKGAYCGTTHCRAGWVVALAGEAGRLLELETDTPFAAQQIYKKSCPEINVSPVRFFENNIEAMQDIKRCAEEEVKLKKS